MANFLSRAIESLGGSKMGDAARFHNPAELKKWKEKSEKSYDRYGKRRDMYEGRAQDEYGRYLKDTGEARRLYGRAESATGAAQAGITSAAMRERRAGELADDRQHYAGLRERSMERQKQRESYRLGLESQRYQPGSFDAVQSMVMDAAKMGNEAAMEQTQAVASNLSRMGNPVAAAKLMMDAQNTAGTNLAKAKQQGWFAGQENRMKEMQVDANRIMQQANMLGQEDQADQVMAQAHRERMTDQMNLATAGLNRSQANLGMASSYGAQGDRFANLGGRSLQASMGYDQFGDAMSDRRTSIEEQRMGREQELMLSDRMAQQQVDEYNAGRMGRGIQTGLAIAGTAANMYTGIQAGRAASAEASMYNRMAQPVNDSSGFDPADIRKHGRQFIGSDPISFGVDSGSSSSSGGFSGAGRTGAFQGYDPMTYGARGSRTSMNYSDMGDTSKGGMFNQMKNTGWTFPAEFTGGPGGSTRRAMLDSDRGNTHLARKLTGDSNRRLKYERARGR